MFSFNIVLESLTNGQKNNQNNFDMCFVKFTKLKLKVDTKSKQWLSKLRTFSIKIQLSLVLRANVLHFGIHFELFIIPLAE